MKKINPNIQRADSSAIEYLKNIPPSDFGHRLNFQLISRRKLQPVFKINESFAGSAVTVRIPPNDSVLVYKALEMAQEGDIIVVDMNDEHRYACWGEITTLIAKEKGLSGAIIQGPVTDSLAIEELEFPVYSSSISPLTTKLFSLDGDINVSVSIDNVVINPGDIIIGDNDGLLVIPLEEWEEYKKIGIEEIEADEKRKNSLHNDTLEKYFENFKPYFAKFSDKS